MRPDRPPLDDDSAARMLQGLVQPDDAPPGFGPVAGLLAGAARPAPVDEDAAATTVCAMVEAIREGASAPQTSRRKPMLTKLLAGKTLAAALGVVALTASGAAAATGSLPNPVQNVVAGAVSHVGVDLPHPGDRGNSAGHRQDGVHRPSGHDSQAGGDASTSTTAGPGTTSGGDDQGEGQGHEISDLAHQTKDDGGQVGPTVCAAASDGKCQAGDDHGQGKGGNSGSSDDSTTSTTAGSNAGNGNDQSQGSDDPADHDAQDDHGGDQAKATPPTTVTTATTTTPTGDGAATGDEHSGPGDGGSGSSGKGKSGDSH
jgi:hypothetical protein